MFSESYFRHRKKHNNKMGIEAGKIFFWGQSAVGLPKAERVTGKQEMSDLKSGATGKWLLKAWQNV